MARRYRGPIGAYELWDMANHDQFFTGSPRGLADIWPTWCAAGAIRAADPAATVVCPSMGQLADARHRDYLERFGALGRLRPLRRGRREPLPVTSDRPTGDHGDGDEQITQSFHHSAGHVRLWSTGTDFEVPFQPSADPERAAGHAARFFPTGVYLRYDRMYTCRQGGQSGLPANVWRCDFTRDGKPFEIWWTTRARDTPGADGAVDGRTARRGHIPAGGEPATHW